MKTIHCKTMIAGILLVLSHQVRAQLLFTGDNQTNTINGTDASGPFYYHIGSNYVFDALFILNGGSLWTGSAYIGYYPGGKSNLVSVSGNGSVWTNLSFYVGRDGSANRLVISDGGSVVSKSQSVVGSYGNYNSVLVTGSGSVWTNQNLWMGDGGAFNSMVVSNGGTVFAANGYVGGNWGAGGGKSNTVVVTGAGSVWSNRLRLHIGLMNRGNTLVVSNGGAVFNAGLGIIGTRGNAANNHVLVTGSGSVWRSGAELFVGWGADGGPHTNNQLTVTDAGSVLASSVYVGVNQTASNSLLKVSGGNLTVTNTSGTGAIDVRRGRLVFNGGMITTERLWLTYGTESILEFKSGTLHSSGTVVSNAQPCVVGDGAGSGNFRLVGGVHSFQNGLRIRANSFLTGCGTVHGSVVVDAGGAVHANCTNLVFNSSVTNHGAIVVDGAVLETLGTFVNNGKIYLINGGTTNFHEAFINTGEILNGDTQLHIEREATGVSIRHFGVPAVTYHLQRAASVTGPWSDIATNTAPASGLIEFHHETTPPPGQAFYRTIQP